MEAGFQYKCWPEWCGKRSIKSWFLHMLSVAANSNMELCSLIYYTHFFIGRLASGVERDCSKDGSLICSEKRLTGYLEKGG